MKAMKALLTAALVAVTAPAFAQFSNASSSSSNGGGLGLINNCDPYSRWTLSYVNRSYNPDYKGADGYSTNGVALDYLHGFSLSSSLPIFLETGVGLDFGMWSDSESDDDDYGELEYKTTITTLSFAVPVNVAYKFQLNDSFSLQPFLGLNLKVHALGKESYKLKYDGDDDYVQDWVDDYNDNLESVNLFSKKDMGKDEKWKRFQMGWQIGVGANFNKFYVGLSYGTDFIEIAKKLKTGTFKIGVGINL